MAAEQARPVGNHRETKYYAVTRGAARAPNRQAERWRRISGLVDKLRLPES